MDGYEEANRCFARLCEQAKLRLFKNEKELSAKTVTYIAGQEVKDILKNLRFKMMLTMMFTVLSNVTPCSSVDNTNPFE
jgi:hypothetical protein